MLRETVDTMLAHYREYVGRCGHLEGIISHGERQLKRFHADPADEMVGGSCSVVKFPAKSGISDPTSRIGLMLASNFTPATIKDMEAEISSAKAELDEKLPTVVFVDAWLKGLSEKERWLIESQILDGNVWSLVAAQHYVRYGAKISVKTLKRLKYKTLEKIYFFAS